MRLAGRGDHYYERYYTRAGLRRQLKDYDVWDYTLPVLTESTALSADDGRVPRWVGSVHSPILAAALPLAPMYVWVAFKGRGVPAGPSLPLSREGLKVGLDVWFAAF